MEKVTSQWLEETSEELKKQGVTDWEQKTHLARQKWLEENVKKMRQDESIDRKLLDQHIKKQIEKIESYFITQLGRDRGWIKLPFVGIYYFHRDFWEIAVPLIMGRVGINFFDCLKMPPELKSILYADEDAVDEFINVAADSIDYGYGIKEVESLCSNDFSIGLFGSADKHLRATISLLNQEDASSKAIEDARMSIEIFLKAYLTVKENLTDEDLRKQIGHNIEKATDRCIAHGLNELTAVKSRLHLLPQVTARYEASERSLGELWTAYRLAQFTGVTVLRHLTGRDIRSSIKRR